MRFIKENKDIIKLALPISLSIAIPQFSFLTNTAFLGRLGERELGINGIVGIYYMIISMIGYGLSIGVQIQMARRAGEKDKEKLSQTFVNGLMLSFFFSLALMLLSLWFAPIIFSISLHDSTNITVSISYLFIRIWGLPFLMLTQIINSFFISIQKSRFLIYGSLTTTLATILFDYMLIFGHYGFPQLGLKGSAIASCIGEITGLLTMAILFYYHQFYRTYPVQRFLQMDLQLSKRSLKVASPLIVQFLFSIGGWQVFFFFVEHLGNKELAASQILRSIFGIAGIGTWALASTCNTMVSHAMGEGHPEKVIPIVKRINKVSLLYAFILCVVLLTFSREFLSLYRNDDALITLAQPSLRVIVVAMLIMSLATVTFNGVVGTGKTFINLAIEITCVSSYLIYCYIVIQRMRLPLQWAWASEFVYWTALLLTSSLYLRSKRWTGKKI